MILENVIDDYFELINFPKLSGKISGVYKIGSVYVGASTNILKRMKQHYKSVITGNFTNIDLAIYINDCLSQGDSIQVEYLAFDVMDEAYFTVKHGIKPLKFAKFYHQIYSKN